MGDFVAAFSSIFKGKGWVVSWLLFTAMLVIPVVGPFVAIGWWLERVRRVSRGDTDVPRLAFVPMLREGFVAFFGLLAWGVISSLTLGLGGLLSPAFTANYTQKGKLKAFFGFGDAISAVKRNPVGYLKAVFFPLLAMLPILAAYGVVAAVASPSVGSVSEAVASAMPLLAVSLLAGLLYFFVGMASSYWLGKYAAAGYALAAPGLSDLSVAAGVISSPDVAMPAAAFVPAPAPTAPAAPKNSVAVFTDAAAALNPQLPGTSVTYDGATRSFAVPLLGKTVPAAAVIQMDDRGLLSWPREDVHKAIRDMAAKESVAPQD